ncbi:MAG: hypothetical protein JWN03_5904 [Nocardia sp.]|nr:hypothetical protein [Nocardia sp.]MCU1645629.1 hypothetical protein [Nocardia sp.]
MPRGGAAFSVGLRKRRGSGQRIAHELNSADGFDGMIAWLGEHGFDSWI